MNYFTLSLVVILKKQSIYDVQKIKLQLVTNITWTDHTFIKKYQKTIWLPSE